MDRAPPPPPTLEALLEFLVEAPLFEHLDETELAEFVHMLEIQAVGAGTALFREGDPADAWYVVYDGRIEIVRRRGDGTVDVLVSLGPRACFGEMAALDGAFRSATARAVADTVLLRVPRAAFNAHLRSGRLVAYKLVHRIALLLIARVRALNARVVRDEGEVVSLEVLDRVEDPGGAAG